MNSKLRLHELGRLSKEEFVSKEKQDLIILLDNVRSLYNVGSIFRSADAFLAKKIVLAGITGTPPQREITKTAIGAENTVNWEYTKSALEWLLHWKEQNNHSIISIEQTEKSISLHQFDFFQMPSILVLGNEVHGVSQEIIDISDFSISVPQLGTKHSLNVSVCAGMVMWEYSKQNKQFS